MSTLTDLSRFALDVLDGKEVGLRDLLTLAQKLTDQDAFVLARDLLDLARKRKVEDKDSVRAEATKVELAQKHALYTYKATDTPLEKSLVAARDILEQVDNLATTKNQETLGLAGAIAKRLWQTTSEKLHLEESLRFYLRGYEQGSTTDGGYNGINASYVQDVLARLEEEEAHERGGASKRATALRQQSKTIRRELIKDLPKVAAKKPELEQNWWYVATMAEAHLGLGNCEESASWLERAKKLPFVPNWMYESTARQLTSLARLVPDPEEGDKPSVVPVDVLIDLIRGRCRPAAAIIPPVIGETGARRGVRRTLPWLLLGLLLVLLLLFLWCPRTADLGVNLTANTVCAEVGETITFALAVENGGPWAQKNVRVTIWGGGTPHMRLALEALGRKEIDSLEFRLAVTPDMESPLVMSAGGSGDRRDPVLGNYLSSVRIPVGGISPTGLCLLKQADAARVSTNDTLTYTLAVVNVGRNAVSNERVIDTLPEGVRYVPQVRDGVAAAGRVITWAVPTLSPGDSMALTLGVVVTDARDTLVNTAGVRGAPNTRRIVRTPFDPGPVARLGLTKAGPTSVQADAGVTFTLQVTNGGDGTAQDVELTDTLPAGVQFVRASDNGERRGRVVAWRLDSLSAGGSFTRTVGVVAPGGCVGSLRNAAAVTWSPEGRDRAVRQTRVLDPACPDSVNLRVSLTRSPKPVSIRGTLVDSVRVTNAGPDTATNVIVRTADGTTLPGSGFTLAPGADAVITRNTVVGPAPGAITESVTVAADERDWDLGDNRAIDSAVVRSPGMVLVGLSSFYVRDTVSFEVLTETTLSSRFDVVDSMYQAYTPPIALTGDSRPFQTIRVLTVAVKHPPTREHTDSLIREGAAKLIGGQFRPGTARVKKFIAIRHTLRDNEVRLTGSDPWLTVGPTGARESVPVRVTFGADSVIADVLRSPSDSLASEVKAYLERPGRFEWGVAPGETVIEGVIVVGRSP